MTAGGWISFRRGPIENAFDYVAHHFLPMVDSLFISVIWTPGWNHKGIYQAYKWEHADELYNGIHRRIRNPYVTIG